MKKIISLTLIPLLVGFAIGYALSLSESDKDLLAAGEAKADSENTSPSHKIDDEKKRRKAFQPQRIKQKISKKLKNF